MNYIYICMYKYTFVYVYKCVFICIDTCFEHMGPRKREDVFTRICPNVGRLTRHCFTVWSHIVKEKKQQIECLLKYRFSSWPVLFSFNQLSFFDFSSFRFSFFFSSLFYRFLLFTCIFCLFLAFSYTCFFFLSFILVFFS